MGDATLVLHGATTATGATTAIAGTTASTTTVTVAVTTESTGVEASIPT
jgi:hypothetical protein